jgi:inosine-uridine nucleoside N-ribohydrolase
VKQIAVLLLALLPQVCAQKRLVLIDEDGSGPATTNQMSMMALLQSPQVEVLGLTMVTGDGWRDEEVQHTLRMLELIGRRGVPVAPGAVFPLVRTQEETLRALPRNGKPEWLGAWSAGIHGPWEIPPLPEGTPATKPLAEDAAHFLIRQVRAHPGQVTIYAGGPLTNIALAISLDSRFAGLTKGIVLMGGSLNPPHEFNFWFDPEAAHIVLRAPWPRIDVTTLDVSVKAMFSDSMFQAISRASTPAARYIAKYATERSYLWDELAACAWLDPSIITKERRLYLDVDISHGPRYGDTLTSETGVQRVHAQLDLDLAKFTKMFVDLMSR